MLEKSDIISLEAAKLLSKLTLGIPAAVVYYRRPWTSKVDTASFGVMQNVPLVFVLEDDFTVLAPELHLVQKYLREERGIHVMVFCNACGWGWELMDTRGTSMMGFDERGDDEDSGMWSTFEGALGAGITNALLHILQPTLSGESKCVCV